MKYLNIESIEGVIKNFKENITHISAETLGWMGVILINLATIPTLVAILMGLTEKVPPVDLVLAMWGGLFLFFIKASISKDLLNIVTIGLGFFVQAALMALILFK
jgi:hypothetical protein